MSSPSSWCTRLHVVKSVVYLLYSQGSCPQGNHWLPWSSAAAACRSLSKLPRLILFFNPSTRQSFHPMRRVTVTPLPLPIPFSPAILQSYLQQQSLQPPPPPPHLPLHIPHKFPLPFLSLNPHLLVHHSLTVDEPFLNSPLLHRSPSPSPRTHSPLPVP